MQDLNNQTTALTFDLVQDDSPITLGMDVSQHSVINFSSEYPTMTATRPTDKSPRVLSIYIDGASKFQTRGRILIVPIAHVTSSLMATNAVSATSRPMATAKRMLRFTHATAEELIQICITANWLTPDLEKSIRTVSAACRVCTESGLPTPSKKVSLTHVNEAFNQHVQVDFTLCTIRGTQYTVLHMICAGTVYSETQIMSNREAVNITRVLDTEWFNRHGAPNSLSADDELSCKHIRTFLKTRDVQFDPRPARKHNKTGRVERKHRTLKAILERVAKEPTSEPDRLILSRATFFSNCFSDTRILSSFELARGYAPSILGTSPRKVSAELLSAHKEQVAVRAVQRLLHARAPSLVPQSSIKPGNIVLYYYSSSKNNEPDEWREAKVISTNPHFVEARRVGTTRGSASKIAYEDLRLRPDQPLTHKLMDSTIEEYLLSSHGGETRQTHPMRNEDVPNATHHPGAMFTTSHKEDSDPASRDIGPYSTSQADVRNDLTKVLTSTEQFELKKVHERIGHKQVASREVEFVPSWVLQNAMEREHSNNWLGAYEEIPESHVPRGANVIFSHTFFKVKSHEDDRLEMKARFVLHGNCDKQKDEIRKDSAAADMTVFRLVISLGSILGLTFGVADIKGAYMQSGPATGDIYVRPPKEWKSTRGMLWKLLKLAYGIVEAGRQWLKTVETWIIEEAGVERVFGVSQLFVKRDQANKVTLLIAKVTDDFLVSGTPEAIKHFMDELSVRFEVGKIRVGQDFYFNGCEVTFNNHGNVTLSIDNYMRRLKPIQISRSRRQEQEAKADTREEAEYRSLAGTLMYLGTAIVPQASLVTSRMQQRLGDLRVKHIIDANTMLREILKLPMKITCLKPSSISGAILMSLSDASHGGSEFDYGQTEGMCGLKIDSPAWNEPLFHPISWTSHKQKRVTYSSFGAEILACADAEDRGFDMKGSFASLFPNKPVKHEILVDSGALFDTITTLHECKENRLQKTVTRIRNAFEAKELDSIRWIPGTKNVADALTKRSTELWHHLSEMLSTGFWKINDDTGYHHESKKWK